MTPPRRIIKGATLFITFRAVGRSFRFLPTKEVRQIIEYTLAATLESYANLIHMHEYVFLSNHGHFLLTDVAGVLPNFMRDLNSLISRNLNASRGHRGANFEDGYNIVRPLPDREGSMDDKIIEHAVYTLANAPSAHLVARARHWKGPSSSKLPYNKTILVSRPNYGTWKYLGEQSKDSIHRNPSHKRRKEKKRLQYSGTKFPEVARFKLVRPPIRQEMSDGELRHEILRQLNERELELIFERSKNGRTVMGMKLVLKQNWQLSPRNKEDMFSTIPSVSGRSKWARIEALQHLGAFLQDYRRALQSFIRHELDICFPHGTWLMRIRYATPCASS